MMNKRTMKPLHEFSRSKCSGRQPSLWSLVVCLLLSGCGDQVGTPGKWDEYKRLPKGNIAIEVSNGSPRDRTVVIMWDGQCIAGSHVGFADQRHQFRSHEYVAWVSSTGGQHSLRLWDSLAGLSPEYVVSIDPHVARYSLDVMILSAAACSSNATYRFRILTNVYEKGVM